MLKTIFLIFSSIILLGCMKQNNGKIFEDQNNIENNFYINNMLHNLLDYKSIELGKLELNENNISEMIKVNGKIIERNYSCLFVSIDGSRSYCDVLHIENVIQLEKPLQIIINGEKREYYILKMICNNIIKNNIILNNDSYIYGKLFLKNNEETNTIELVLNLIGIEKSKNTFEYIEIPFLYNGYMIVNE